MIQRWEESDFDVVWSIVNDGAEAYRGIIPADRWNEPYMSRDKLRQEIQSGVEFWIYKDQAVALGVMGIQKVEDVTLVRHAYVRTCSRRLGVGSKLLVHLRELTADPILIGAWADAGWAISFYQGHGFKMVAPEEKTRLLRRYWTVPERQIETSVVLADDRWRSKHGV